MNQCNQNSQQRSLFISLLVGTAAILLAIGLHTRHQHAKATVEARPKNYSAEPAAVDLVTNRSPSGGAVNQKGAERQEATPPQPGAGQAPTVEKKKQFNAAFGQAFGTGYDPTKAVLAVPTRLGMLCQFRPEHPHNYFTKYYLVLTPKTHKIYRILAEGPYVDESESYFRMNALLEQLQNQYGLESKSGDRTAKSAEVKSEDGRYSITIAYEGQGLETKLRIDCFCLPLLNDAVTEVSQLEQQKAKDAARNNPPL